MLQDLWVKGTRGLCQAREAFPVAFDPESEYVMFDAPAGDGVDGGCDVSLQLAGGRGGDTQLAAAPCGRPWSQAALWPCGALPARVSGPLAPESRRGRARSQRRRSGGSWLWCQTWLRFSFTFSLLHVYLLWQQRALRPSY